MRCHLIPKASEALKLTIHEFFEAFITFGSFYRDEFPLKILTFQKRYVEEINMRRDYITIEKLNPR